MVIQDVNVYESEKIMQTNKNTAVAKPKNGDKYYWLSSSTCARGFYPNLHKAIWTNSKMDKELFNDNNFFKSKKEARFVYDSFHGTF